MSKQVAEKKATDVVVHQGFEELAGAGFSEVSTEDLAIPFLRILAQLSPQVNKREGAYVEGAEAGMIYNTVLNDVYDGVEGIQVVPCHYNRRMVEWKKREEGGGYVDSYMPDDSYCNQAIRDERGQDVLPNGNILTNTAQFFVLLLHPELGPQRALVTMSSTQLKKSRKWLSQMQSLTAKGQNGVFVLPMMSQVYNLTTVAESNDKGSWFGWEVSRVRQLDLDTENDLFDMAVAFAQSIKAGEVKVKQEQDTETTTPDEGDFM